MQPKTLLIAAYLGANVAANLIIAATPLDWRWLVSIVLALLFIGFDLVARDRLHDLWAGDPRPLSTLILGGAALSALVNRDAWPVALASCLAFALSGAADSVAYHYLRGSAWPTRANGSNVAGALVDTTVFLGLAAALGVFPWFTVPLAWAGQVVAKTVGGAAWVWALGRTRGRA